MAYSPEFDDHRQEVRQGHASGSIAFWPKVAGVGNVSISAPTFVLYDARGNSLASGTATVTTHNSVSRVSCAVNASSLALGENYYAIITWAYGGVTYVNTVRFDVVLEPWSGSDVSINDLIEEVADIGDLIDRQAAAVSTSIASGSVTNIHALGDYITFTVGADHPWLPGMRFRVSGTGTGFDLAEGLYYTANSITATTVVYYEEGVSYALFDQAVSGTIESEDEIARTREQHASIVAIKACSDVKAWIRSQLETKGRIYPRLIINREDLRRVVVAQAVSRIYRAQGGGPDSVHRVLADDWESRARTRLTELGEIDYDEDENRVPDSTIGGWATVQIGRSWS